MWLFELQAVGLFVLAAPVAIGAAIAVRRARGRRRRIAAAVLAVSVLAMSAIVLAPTASLLRDVDFARSVGRRNEVVEMVRQGRLTETIFNGETALPDGYRDLTVWGGISVEGSGTDAPIVFFMTVTGFSPDPYWGFEYAGDSPPIVDPNGSGVGTAEPLGGGWYWIAAH